ncbi:putative glucokinase [Oceanicola granulosus HTCC2516]|uniref:Putative glucokinase n=1 Tax=Oceanicola granulosus (strain ATCC BAA-861 / DSM 15982 / KCTC 12143 / HTCC2516) TaxID=314256 RepID=Q2CHP2_OCEGH|nr:ROK family protein [Oceanicola granulosus]EAR52252.1 putative glucokinase [Oceanicola granulosus HTCC2516]
MPHPPNKLSLVADIGGTNTRVALADGRRVLEPTIRRYRNAEFAGLESVLRRFIADEGDVDCVAACVAVAGPVRDGRATMTNLDWTMDRSTVSRATRAETVAVLNDLQAQGHALGHVAEGNIRTIVSGPDTQPHETKLVIGVGTGFNAAPVHETRVGRVVAPSECGHANLPIRSEAELKLCQFVSTAHGFPAIEDVLSGRGLERVYAWLGAEAGSPAEAKAADIMAACADGSDPRATEAARTFAQILGTVCGNLALIHLPFGGVFLVGGVARAIAPYLDGFDFDAAFRDKGRFAGFMANFAVCVVEDDYAALTGCAAHLVELSD